MEQEEPKDIFSGLTKKEQEETLKKIQEEEMKQQRQRDISDLVNQQNMPLRSQPEALDRIIRPHMVRGSEYHLYQSKNLPIGFYDVEDGILITLMERQKNLTLFMANSGIVDRALVDHVNSVHEAWINYKRGVGGKTANMIAKQDITVTSIEEKQEKKGTGFKPR